MDIFHVFKLQKRYKIAQSITYEDHESNMGNVTEMGKLSNIGTVPYYRHCPHSTVTELLNEF